MNLSTRLLRVASACLSLSLLGAFSSCGTRNGAPVGETSALHNPAYQRLQDAHEFYAGIAKNGGWAEVGSYKGEWAEANPLWLKKLARRLAVTEDFKGTLSETPTPEEIAQLEKAVVRFQARTGLKPDGKVGDGTVAELNVSAADRAQQLEANLKAWKEIADQWIAGQRYIIVNIPEFKMRAYQHNQEVLEMKVVVGREYEDNATPLFSAELDRVVFAPYWNVPLSIAQEEVVPDIRKDWDSFRRLGYEIVDDWVPDAKTYELSGDNLKKVEEGKLLIRQKPGPHNPLGLVKFLFPNKHSIYMHDTNARHLFNQQRRDASHGCIRIERPADLAAFVLSDEGPAWTSQKIGDAMSQQEQKVVDLSQRIPVYIRYWTTYVDDDGTVQFRKDVYNQMLKISGL